MNVAALKMAREVADKHGCLMAGNICNSTVYIADVPETHKGTEDIFKVDDSSTCTYYTCTCTYSVYMYAKFQASM